jgi:hypothetical protein
MDLLNECELRLIFVFDPAGDPWRTGREEDIE